MRRFRIGDKVKIQFKPGDIAVSNEMRALDGTIAVISWKRCVKSGKKTSSNTPNSYYYYQLRGVKSKKGIPFAFSEDMLIALEG